MMVENAVNYKYQLNLIPYYTMIQRFCVLLIILVMRGVCFCSIISAIL